MLRHRWLAVSLTMLHLTVLLLLTQPSSEAETAQPTSWQVVGQIGGPTQAVAVQGDYAYVGIGLRLVVLDVTNPVTPTEMGATAPFPYFVEDIAVSGSRACVAAGGAGLRVVDVSDPANPVEIGVWDSPGYAEGVAVAGNTVYLADGPYGLRVVDVSEPAHPVPVGAAYDMNYAFEVAVSGHHAYIAAAGAGLLVADVSDPVHPVEVGTLDTPGYAYGVAGDREGRPYVYVADGWEGVRLVDVSNPSAPIAVSTYKTPGWAFDTTISGTRAYVADAFMGLRVLDVSDPTHPVELGGYETAGGHAGSVAVAGNTAYVADRNGGLRVMSVADPAHPTQVGLYDPLSYADGVWVDGDYAYVAAGKYGLRVVDISDPTHPVQDGRYATVAFATSVVVSGNYALVAAAGGEGDGLHVVDVSDPAYPHRVGFNPSTGVGAYRDMAVVGGIAYLPDELGLELVSVSNPFSPTLLGTIELWEWFGAPDAAVGVAVSGTLAYVASSFAGLEVVDVSSPVSPTLIGGYNSGESFSQDVAVVGHIVYLADGFGLRIVNVSDPAHPTGMGFYDTPGEAGGVFVSGTLAYVADGSRGVSVIDVSNPFSPTLVGDFNTLGYAQEVMVVGNRVFVADGPNGLLILESAPGDSTHRLSARTDNLRQAHSLATTQRWPNPVQPVSSVPPARPVTSPPSVPARRVSTETDARAPGLGSTCTVTIPADSGAGSLRECLENAVSGTLVTFDPLVFPPTNPVTIMLLSELPPLDDGQVTVDASNAGVILDGSVTPAGTPGLKIDSDGNIIRGLQILRFPGSGIWLQVGEYNVIGGSREIGNGPLGQGNLISANRGDGISLSDAFSNTISGNLIGTDVHGTAAWGNGGFAGIMQGGAYNIIGGTRPGERNVVSGNLGNGIGDGGGRPHGNLVIGNYVGTDITGSFDLGNRGHGISFEFGYNNRVEGNLSSGNGRAGLLANGGNYNTFVGNRVGTDASGAKAIPNDWCGVYVGSASFTRVGGTSPGEGNLVSGNPCGIEVGGPGGNVGNLVLGNLVGTDINGMQPLPNVYSGVSLGSGGRAIVGGATAAERNVISGNGWPNGWPGGIDIAGDYHVVSGNYIGTDASGAAAVGNRGVGIWFRGAEHSIVQGNLIAHNTEHGVYVESYAFNTLRRNAIYGHGGQGISLGGGNQMLPAPVILTVTETSVSGTACPGCTVEVFSDDEDEGRIYEGSAVADAGGLFAFDKGGPFTGPHLTATTTDGSGNTSELV
jgi:parallel beta-helix repeat protein